MVRTIRSRLPIKRPRFSSSTSKVACDVTNCCAPVEGSSSCAADDGRDGGDGGDGGDDGDDGGGGGDDGGGADAAPDTDPDAASDAALGATASDSWRKGCDSPAT